jgi:hypothetical protein
MKHHINVGDLLLRRDTQLYYVSDIRYCQDIEENKFILILLNSKDKLMISKLILYPDNLDKIFDPDSLTNKNWKYYPVIQYEKKCIRYR